MGSEFDMGCSEPLRRGDDTLRLVERQAGARGEPYFAFAGSSQGTIGIKFVEGVASGDAKRTAIAPRSAPVKECVTSG